MTGEKVTHKLRPVGFTYRRKDEGGIKYHIVDCVHDIEKDMWVYVVRYYGKRKQWWHYEAITVKDYDMKLEFNLIEELK